jgi:hypothetical protein
VRHQTGKEVTFDANLVASPFVSHGHERMQVRTPLGDVLEIDHNVDLSTRVPAATGDRVVVRGQLYIDPGQVGVHCTHHETSSGCPSAGFIVFNGHTYD